MNRTLSIILAGMFLSALSFTLQAQSGVESGTPFGKGEDSTKCLRNTSLYSTYYENKDYNMAVQFWRPVFTECPDHQEHLYQGRSNVQGFFPQDR